MARKAKAVAPIAVVESVVETEVVVEQVVETEVVVEQVVATEVVVESVVETEVVESSEPSEVVESSEPSMLATMLQQEVQPLEEVKEEAHKVVVEKNIGVGQFVRRLIAEGLTNTAILKIVHEQYGNTNTTYACVAWYRNKVKKAQALAKTKTATDIVTQFAEGEVESVEEAGESAPSDESAETTE